MSEKQALYNRLLQALENRAILLIHDEVVTEDLYRLMRSLQITTFSAPMSTPEERVIALNLLTVAYAAEIAAMEKLTSREVEIGEISRMAEYAAECGLYGPQAKV
jgi:hypothetical protein